MFENSRYLALLILAILSFASGCHCVPSVRYRNPHAADYESACVCGRSDCGECQHRKEKKKEVPWPLFHPVPTRPVFECGAELQMMGQELPSPTETLPPLQPVPSAAAAEAIDTPPEMQQAAPPGENYSV